MKIFFLRHLLFLLIYAALTSSIQFTFAQKNAADEWVKHIIANQINQDHGHSVNKGDFNGDGRIDISIAWGQRDGGKSTDGIWWYECPLNPKTDSWTKRRITHPNNLVLWSMAHAVGDIDNDGDPDVIAIGFDRGDIQLAVNPLNNGGDVNQPWPTYKIWADSSRKRDGERCEIIDIDGDGYKDFVFPRGQSPMSAFILFNPNGNPEGNWIQKELGGIAGSDAHDIYVTDIDNDGDPDVVSASGDGMTRGAIYWFEHPNGNPGNGSWTRHQVDNESWNYGGLNVEDIDGDGYKDILCNHAHHTPGACGYPDTYNVLWFKNPKGHGRWEEYGIGKQSYPHAASLIDIDGDGVNELWVPDASNKPGDCNYGQYSGGLVYFKRGSDPTQPWEKYRVAKAPAVGRQGAVYDIDGDGDLDIAISSGHDGNHNISLVWWENKTDISTPPLVINSPVNSAVLVPKQAITTTGTGNNLK